MQSERLFPGSRFVLLRAPGSEYVETYVAFVHYVERLYADASAPAGHHRAGKAEGAPAHEHR